MDDKTIARFWAKVEKRGPDDCWEWKGSAGTKGYGVFWLGGSMKLAHRVAFYISRHRWPMPMCCHHCDNPLCVNPSHLFRGSAADNTADCVRKGRHRWGVHPGERSGRTFLTDNDIRDIRASDEPSGVLGSRYGIHKATVWSIRSRHSWRHIT